MRDVHNFSSPSVKLYSKSVKQLCWGGPEIYGPTTFSTSPGTRKIARTQRSEAIPTTPSGDGAYYAPTPYQAYFCTTTSYPGTVDIANPSSWANECTLSPTRPRYRYWTKYWWDESTDWGAWDIGVDSLLHPIIPLSVTASARSQVLGSLAINSLDAGVFLGELRESVGTVASLVKDAVKLFRSLRRPLGAFSAVNLADAQSNRTRAAREYLRYMYGIRPIMNDIHGVLSALENGFYNTPAGFAKGVSIDPNFNAGSYGSAYFPLESNIDTVSGEFRRGVEVAAYYKVASPARYALNSYGLSNPLALAWELTTLSFVVDWFTGVGNFLRGLTAGFGLDYLSGYETDFLSIDGVLHHRVVSKSLLALDGDPVMKCGLRVRAMKRTAEPGFLPPPVYLKVDLNLGQVLSSLALLTASHK
jgi:hypothetical protein